VEEGRIIGEILNATLAPSPSERVILLCLPESTLSDECLLVIYLLPLRSNGGLRGCELELLS